MSNGKSICIIGAGPGGYVAAIRAAQLDNKVTIIDKSKVGGVCLNRGCIPTKTLLRSAEVFELLKHAKNYGIKASDVDYDWKQIMVRKKRIVAKLTAGVSFLLKKHNVEVINGSASFLSPQEVQVILPDDTLRTVTADNFIIASGSRPSVLKLEGDGVDSVINSDGLLSLPEVPQSMLIIGGGVIGIEFASLYRSFGSQIQVVEFLPSILANLDGEISSSITNIFEKQGMTITANTGVAAVNKKDGLFEVTYRRRGADEDVKVTAHCVAMAAGRIPNVEDLGLEQAGVTFDKKGITCDKQMRTSQPHIYTIGDVAGIYQLAHTASHEGIVAVEHISGMDVSMHYNAVPSCIYTHPEVACVGATEEQLKDQGVVYDVGNFPLSASGRALTCGDQEGLIKILTDSKTHKVLGLHMIGAHVSELLPEAVLGINFEASAEDISNAIHAHPSLSEGIMEAALGSLGRGIHI